MKPICFFTEGHNGDIVHSKTFIYDIVTQLDVPCFYHHKRNFKITQDLPLTATQIAPSSYFEKFIDTKKIFFVNTWLWPYLCLDERTNTLCVDQFTQGVCLETNYKIFQGIYDKINELYNTNLKLKSIENYFPFIDFNFVEKENIDNYVLTHKNKKILLSNGPCLSGQSPYNEDMSSIINRLAVEYRHIDFIATQKFESRNDNVYFTNDIINIKGCDLNEIGYLSTFCDLIVGRNSGPFCFSTIRENYNDPEKIFYAFGHNPTDCFHGKVKINAKFLFNNADSEVLVYESIKSIIEQML